MFKPEPILTILAIALGWYVTIAVLYTSYHLALDFFR
jgi:hypothetical protein